MLLQEQTAVNKETVAALLVKARSSINVHVWLKDDSSAHHYHPKISKHAPGGICHLPSSEGPLLLLDCIVCTKVCWVVGANTTQTTLFTLLVMSPSAAKPACVDLCWLRVDDLRTIGCRAPCMLHCVYRWTDPSHSCASAHAAFPISLDSASWSAWMIGPPRLHSPTLTLSASSALSATSGAFCHLTAIEGCDVWGTPLIVS